jgi:hypothetical protein
MSRYPTVHNSTYTREQSNLTDLVVLVAIEFEEHNIKVILGHLLEFRCHHLARAAPANKKNTRQSSDSAIHSEVRLTLFFSSWYED